MDDRCLKLVREYVIERYRSNGEELPEFEVYTVLKCKILKNWKYLASTTLPDGMYYELTFDGDKERWYLDAYKKVENQVIEC